MRISKLHKHCVIWYAMNSWDIQSNIMCENSFVTAILLSVSQTPMNSVCIVQLCLFKLFLSFVISAFYHTVHVRLFVPHQTQVTAALFRFLFLFSVKLFSFFSLFVLSLIRLP